MITLTAKIDLISGNNGTLSGVSSEISKNNISSDITAIKGVKSQSTNPFIIGASKIGDGSTLSDNLSNLFISKSLYKSGLGFITYNQNGTESYASSYTITVSGSNISALTIAFDIINNRHPKTINIDGVNYADDDAVFTIKLTSADTHTITIDNWNTENYPIVITGIYIDISIDINSRNLISLERTIQDRSDFKLPSYGIISNTGNLEFNDLDGEIRDYAEMLLLNSGAKCTISLNNTLAGAEQVVGTFQTDKWDYDNNNRSVSVSLKDDLEEWQEIPFDGYSLKSSAKTMSVLYNYIKSKTPSKWEFIIDANASIVLSKVKVEYPFMEKSSLWDAWQKLCEICGLYIYKNNNNKVVLSSDLGE